MPSGESRKKVVGQMGEALDTQASEEPSAGGESRTRASSAGGGARSRTIRKVKLALVW